MIKKILLILLLVVAHQNANAKTNEEAVNKHEIIEFFYYGCPHCLHMNNKTKKIRSNDKINYRKVPVAFNELMELAAKHYYTAEILGIADDFSERYYKEIHDNHVYISDEVALDIMDDYFDKDVVLQNMNSNLVKTKIDESKILTKRYNVVVFPQFVINRNNHLNASNSGGYQGLVDRINKIILNPLD